MKVPWKKDKNSTARAESSTYKKAQPPPPVPIVLEPQTRFTEIMYVARVTKINPYSMGPSITTGLGIFSELREAVEHSVDKKVAIYSLSHEKCFEIVRPEPIVREVECGSKEK